MSKQFQATISKWVQQTQVALTAVAQEAAQELSEEVTKPRKIGGNMPVVTAFLVNSLQAGLNEIPMGEGQAPKGYNAKQTLAPVTLVINKLKAGDRLVLGFTANYARAMEARYFFVRLAAQNWQQYVDKAVRKIERGVGK